MSNVDKIKGPESSLPVCNWSFELLNPNHPDPAYRSFCQCEDCDAKFIKRFIQRGTCTVCGSNNFIDAEVNGLTNRAKPAERVANDGFSANVGSLREKPVGASTSVLALGLGENRVRIVNNYSSHLVVDSTDFPIWVSHDNSPGMRGIPIPPGSAFDVSFWGQLMRTHTREFGIIRLLTTNNSKKSDDELGEFKIRLFIKNCLPFSMLWPVSCLAVFSFFISIIFLGITLFNFPQSSEESSGFWYGLLRYTFAATIPLFLFFVLSPGIVRKAVEGLLKATKLKAPDALHVFQSSTERRPSGIYLGIIWFPLTYLFVLVVSLIGFFLLSLIGLLSHWFFIILILIFYMLAGIKLIDGWMNVYGIHVVGGLLQAIPPYRK